MPLNKSLKLIDKAKEEVTKEFYYQLWLARYPMYDKKNYESFDEFYEKCRPKKIDYDMRDKDVIMEEILEAQNKARKEK